jgi:hypothetical protein
LPAGDPQASDFSLDEARSVLEAVRALAPDGLSAPLSRADLATVLAAGIEVKSVDQGLLDFPTHVAGVPAYWCWRSGEASIDWWHPREDGFAGRRRVDH